MKPTYIFPVVRTDILVFVLIRQKAAAEGIGGTRIHTRNAHNKPILQCFFLARYNRIVVFAFIAS